ncbi:MAG: LysM peptidoglycan-binding domain-containing protein [Gammaproteobacteria bacterium]|nr:LysM peptidoglycan-binding domain-containing protein [Gammaproteobacteria bacterium]
MNGDSENYTAPTTSSSGNLWSSIPKGFQLDDNANLPEVKAQIRWFMSHQDYLQRVATRAIPYAYYILQEVNARDMPTEIALLPIVESAYDPFMYSRAGAAGLWQFMPGTASGFKLRQDWWYDGRLDIFTSTKAALDYLVYLHNYFNGDWLLAIAAYNSGEGAVENAVKRNAKKGLPTDFWHLKLPLETRSYVPKLLALAAILNNPQTYPIELPPIPDAPYLATVTVGSQINLDKAADYAGISTEQLYTLNPGYKKWATDPNGPHKLIIPIDSVTKFKAAIAATPPGQSINWANYQVRPGDSLKKIAAQHQTTPTLLQKLNNLNSKAVRVGQALLIPIGSRDLSNKVIDSVKHYLTTDDKLPGPTRNTYTVKSGDTLEKIAKRYHVSIYQLAYWNQLSTKADLTVGDNLIMWSKAPRSRGQYYASQARPYTMNYTVQAEDTLRSIAAQYNVSLSDLRKANNLKSDTVHEGQIIAIPPGVRRLTVVGAKKQTTSYYRVKSGDTVSTIARRYGVKASDLAHWNNIKNNNIRAGQTLVINKKS